jgi:hypothetical protein
MRSFKIITAILTLTLLFGAAANFALANGQSSGYVQYQVAISSSEKSALPITAVVNETVQPTGQTGFVDLTLFISSNAENFTYSRDVNSSSLPEIFPYLPALTNQSLSYEVKGFSIRASIVDAGQVAVTFNSATYQATKYLVSFSAVNSSSAKSFYGNGDIISMPSGLIDTVQISLNQTASVNLTLLSTNLSLNAPADSINPVGASLLGVALIAAVAIAAPTIFRKTKKNKSKDQTQDSENETGKESSEKHEDEGEKPSYWVD